MGIATPPAGNTYISGTVGGNVSGIVQNGTSDLVLGNIGNGYAAGITIQNGVVLFNSFANSLGSSGNTIFLGNGSTTTNATLDYAATVGSTAALASRSTTPLRSAPRPAKARMSSALPTIISP